MKIQYILEIKDTKSKNKHNSHRILLIQSKNIINQDQWNPSWNRVTEGNKFKNFQTEIEK